MVDETKYFNEEGFTLIETLLVLSIFIVIVSSTIIYFQPPFQTANKRAFFTQLSSDLYYGQLYAIANQQTIRVSFNNERHDIIIYHNLKIVYKRLYDKNVDIKSGTLGKGAYPYFKYLSDGNISEFGDINILIGKEKYKMVMQLGKGRYYFVQVK